MSRYDDLCAAYSVVEKEVLVVDSIVRDLPEKMRSAMATELGIGNEMVPFGESETVRFVELFYSERQENGERTWHKCPFGEDITMDRDGIGHFTIGITLTDRRGTLAMLSPFTRLFVNLAIEDPTPSGVNLRIENGAGGIVKIDLNRPDAYAKAAQTLLDHLIKAFGDPTQCLQLQGPMGFGRGQ